MITFSCAKCTRQFTVTDDMAGKKGRCPKCGTPYTIPTESDILTGGSGTSIHLQPIETPAPRPEPEVARPTPQQPAPPQFDPKKGSIYGLLFNRKPEAEPEGDGPKERLPSDPYEPRRKRRRRQSQIGVLLAILLLALGLAAFLNKDRLHKLWMSSDIREELKELPEKLHHEKKGDESRSQSPK